MSYQEASPPEATAQRRHSKFTPEGVQQIKDLVARGETCQQIATIIGVTVGTLKVTCSRLGISLRRPKVKLLPPKTATGTARTVGAAGEIATFIINMKGTSNNVRGHKFGLGRCFRLSSGLLFPPTASVGTLQTTPPSSCRGEPFQRHQAANVVGQVLQADLGARPHDANRSHDPTARRVLLRSEHMLDASAYPALGVVHSHLR